MHQLRTAVDSDVRFHAEVPLFPFRGLIHLGVAFAVFILELDVPIIVASTIDPVV